jgi:hypothetical protein
LNICILAIAPMPSSGKIISITRDTDLTKGHLDWLLAGCDPRALICSYGICIAAIGRKQLNLGRPTWISAVRTARLRQKSRFKLKHLSNAKFVHSVTLRREFHKILASFQAIFDSEPEFPDGLNP